MIKSKGCVMVLLLVEEIKLALWWKSILLQSYV
jgi:hypothetical protein